MKLFRHWPFVPRGEFGGGPGSSEGKGTLVRSLGEVPWRDSGRCSYSAFRTPRKRKSAVEGTCLSMCRGEALS